MKHIDYGIFQAVFICRDEALLPRYLMDEILAEMSWFKQYLPSPDEEDFEYASHNVGICWFKAEAIDMVRRARNMAILLAAGDIFIREVKTRQPGHILYADEYQIIAKPTKKTPTKWG